MKSIFFKLLYECRMSNYEMWCILQAMYINQKRKEKKKKKWIPQRPKDKHTARTTGENNDCNSANDFVILLGILHA